MKYRFHLWFGGECTVHYSRTRFHPCRTARNWTAVRSKCSICRERKMGQNPLQKCASSYFSLSNSGDCPRPKIRGSGEICNVMESSRTSGQSSSSHVSPQIIGKEDTRRLKRSAFFHFLEIYLHRTSLTPEVFFFIISCIFFSFRSARKKIFFSFLAAEISNITFLTFFLAHVLISSSLWTTWNTRRGFASFSVHDSVTFFTFLPNEKEEECKINEKRARNTIQETVLQRKQVWT